MAPVQPDLHPSDLCLGIDAGGTATRWALADRHGAIAAEGLVGPLHAAQVLAPAGQALWQQTMANLARQVLAIGPPARLHAGLSGFGGSGGSGEAELAHLLGGPFALAPPSISIGNDVELAYRDVCMPGQSHLVYAGTGSIAVFIDAQGRLHRAGGLGVLLDDGGSGYWMAREALRHVWRSEDETPGAWARSPMAVALLEQIGGSEWQHTRRFLAQADRGAVGRLALVLAQTADVDPQAMQILRAAGAELGRLACILIGRHGLLPVVLSGRAAAMHPAIAQACQQALPPGAWLALRQSRGHHAAARMAVAGRLVAG